MLEVMGIPYTGPGIRTSAICMHKSIAKLMFQASSVPTFPFVSFRLDEAPQWGDLSKELGKSPLYYQTSIIGIYSHLHI